jgi:homocitrate synthase NifV
MREGLDVPGVALAIEQKRLLVRRLDGVGVDEVELVAPGHFWNDLEALKELDLGDLRIRSSGLIYGPGSRFLEQIRASSLAVHRVDVLVPLSEKRPPHKRAEKTRCLKDCLRVALDSRDHVGVGFPHATQVEPDFLVELCREAAHWGAERVTLYDTNGSADPFQVVDLVQRVRTVAAGELCFHAHNDLGMATANSVAAVLSGADCLDVTVNGLGDRAGNASLEQVALALHVKGRAHGLRLAGLRDLSRVVEALTRIAVSPLAPVVGEFAFSHKSPSHLDVPELFEAFDPALLGVKRTTCTQ